jgi:hypothetical protein
MAFALQMLRCGAGPAFFAASAPFREVVLSAITPLIRIITPGDRLELVSHIISANRRIGCGGQ